jgi:hypothetical protein
MWCWHIDAGTTFFVIQLTVPVSEPRPVQHDALSQEKERPLERNGNNVN